MEIVLSFALKVYATKDVSMGVYVQKSETIFNDDDTISVTFINQTDNTYNDIHIHLVYNNNLGQSVGYSYSNELVVSFKANSKKTIKFDSMDWEFNQNYTVYADYKDTEYENSWGHFKFDDEIIDVKHTVDLLLTTGALLSLIFFIGDVFLIRKYKNSNR